MEWGQSIRQKTTSKIVQAVGAMLVVRCMSAAGSDKQEEVAYACKEYYICLKQ